MAKDKLKITMKDFFRTEFNETLDDLRTLYEDKCDECDDLYEELAEVKKETYKDKELAKLSKLYEETRNNSVQVLTTKEKKAYDKFFKDHWDKHIKEKYGKEGYEMRKMPLPDWCHQVSFAGTGFGTCTKVRCPICGEEKDITDIEAW